MRLALNYQRVDPSKGGAETYVVDLCRQLVERGHEVDLLANEWREDCLPPEVRKIFVPCRGWTRRERIWSFAESSADLLARTRPDCSIGFINTWGTDVLIPQGGVHDASLEANSKRFPKGLGRELYLLGKRLNPKRELFRKIEARQYDPANSNEFIAVSHMVRRDLERFHRVPAERCHVIPNAIRADRLRVDDPDSVRAGFRSKLGLKNEDPVALFVGHNYALKGLGPLIQALGLRKERDPRSRPIKLVACGGGRVGPFQALTDRLGLANDVHLIGFQDDIRPAFWGADFFALPSYYDPCSLVVFEALACGLPVITTRCNGASELIRDGEHGFVVDHPSETEPLAKALSAMVDDSSRRAMSAAAQILGREQSFDRHVSKLIGVFESVAARKNLRPNTRAHDAA